MPYIQQKFELRPSPIHGRGLFATTFIPKDEAVIDYARSGGSFVSEKEADILLAAGHDFVLQVDENQFFVSIRSDRQEDAYYLNHSCVPNCGISGSLQIVAMRDIAPGEELTFDYAMSESSRFIMECLCQDLECRTRITGWDWKLKPLQGKYAGYFSRYLQDKLGR